jgi:hypothetical protein
MDITTLAAWGEFIGGIAVVVSLIYLASQIRQNSKLLRASTASISNETGSRIGILCADNPEVARVYWAGLADRSALSTPDRQRFDPLIGTFMNGFQQEQQFARDGIIPPSFWRSRLRGTRWQLQQPGMQQWWAEWRKIYDDEFIALVEAMIREGEPAD